MSRCFLIFWAAALFAQQEEVRNPRTLPADVAQNEKTFRSHCSPYHGMKGEGGRGPDLSAGVFYHGSTDADLLRNISDGIEDTEMPGLFYSPDRVWQVVAYIRSLSAGSHPASPSDIAAGDALFNRSGCAGCHRIHTAHSDRYPQRGRSGPLG